MVRARRDSATATRQLRPSARASPSGGGVGALASCSRSRTLWLPTYAAPPPPPALLLAKEEEEEEEEEDAAAPMAPTAPLPPLPPPPDKP